jgi:hypothetical protein
MQPNRQTYIIAITDDEDGDELYDIDTPFPASVTFQRLKSWVASHQEEILAFYAMTLPDFDIVDDWASVMDFFAGAEHTVQRDTGIAICFHNSEEDYMFSSTDKFAEDF